MPFALIRAVIAINNKAISTMPEPLLPHETDEALLESFRYINSVPGKNIRSKLVDCFQLWLNVDDAAVLDAVKVRLNDVS